MNVLTIIIVAFFISISDYHIQPAKDIGHTAINSEAILQDNEVKIIISENGTPASIEQLLNPRTPNMMLRINKERPAT